MAKTPSVAEVILATKESDKKRSTGVDRGNQKKALRSLGHCLKLRIGAHQVRVAQRMNQPRTRNRGGGTSGGEETEEKCDAMKLTFPTIWSQKWN
jgi:hypothetical protein